MLKRLHIEQQQKMLTIDFEGNTLEVCAGETVAAAILAAGAEYTRTTAISGAHRAPYCQMGICFECLMEIDGVPNRQACMVEVREGMKVNRQYGARGLVDEKNV
ncbi:MAG: (2Fe-2S)-binding protein [Desulfuromusa sp.]|nr:(2Fe-2S)-binding protein [Desulfuromusa sp.]